MIDQGVGWSANQIAREHSHGALGRGAYGWLRTETAAAYNPPPVAVSVRKPSSSGYEPYLAKFDGDSRNHQSLGAVGRLDSFLECRC